MTTLRQTLSRALTRGADLLSTLAYLLAPPEPSESPQEGNAGDWDGTCSECGLRAVAELGGVCAGCDDARDAENNGWATPPVVLPAEAEAMLAKQQPRPDAPPPREPLRGSIDWRKYPRDGVPSSSEAAARYDESRIARELRRQGR